MFLQKGNLIFQFSLFYYFLKVSVNGRKGFICSRYLRIEDGHVVCKQLQMGKALKAYVTSMYFSFSTPILVRHPLCMGKFVILL